MNVVPLVIPKGSIHIIRPVYASHFIGPIARSLRSLSTSGHRFDSKLPHSTDPTSDLQSNEFSSRIPKFPLHQDLAPSLIPKPDTPRVNEHFTFRQLMETLKSTRSPELVYVAESHRLYFLACFAFAFVAAYNFFDMLTLVLPAAYGAYQEEAESKKTEQGIDSTSSMESLGTLIRRFGLVTVMSGAYLVTGLFFVTFPSRLVRRIEVDVPSGLMRMVTHPIMPGKPSPVITAPIADLYVSPRTKVWTGSGFYGAASKSSFFFFVWEKGRRFPWVVDRSGWFWGDARVFDVVLGKEPIAIAERGLSYDDGLNRQKLEAEKKRAELRRELGPAWRFKESTRMMIDDASKFSEASKRAVLASLQSTHSRGKSLPAKDEISEKQAVSDKKAEK